MQQRRVGILRQPVFLLQDMREYIDSLRVSIVEAYTGITGGLQDGGKIDQLYPYIEGIFAFIAGVVQDPSISNELLKATIGLIGDLGQAIGQPLLQHLTSPVIQTTIVLGTSRGQGSTQDDVDHTLLETTKYTQGVSSVTLTLFLSQCFNVFPFSYFHQIIDKIRTGVK